MANSTDPGIVGTVRSFAVCIRVGAAQYAVAIQKAFAPRARLNVSYAADTKHVDWVSASCLVLRVPARSDAGDRAVPNQRVSAVAFIAVASFVTVSVAWLAAGAVVWVKGGLTVAVCCVGELAEIANVSGVAGALAGGVDDTDRIARFVVGEFGAGGSEACGWTIADARPVGLRSSSVVARFAVGVLACWPNSISGCTYAGYWIIAILLAYIMCARTRICIAFDCTLVASTSRPSTVTRA